jgi:hypothetical protein
VKKQAQQSAGVFLRYEKAYSWLPPHGKIEQM